MKKKDNGFFDVMMFLADGTLACRLAPGQEHKVEEARKAIQDVACMVPPLPGPSGQRAIEKAVRDSLPKSTWKGPRK